jgi:hypothetical protein
VTDSPTTKTHAPTSEGGLSYTPPTSVRRIKSSACVSLATSPASESLSEKIVASVYPWLALTASFSLMMGTMPCMVVVVVAVCVDVGMVGEWGGVE